MTPILQNLCDKKVKRAISQLLIKGYTNYKISSAIPRKIISILEKNTKTNLAIKKVYALPEFKNKASVFWLKRKNYDFKMARHYQIFQYIKKWLVGNIILDIGCGSGNLDKIIAEKFKSKRVIGTDMLDLVNSRVGRNLFFKRQKSAYTIPVKNRFADAILLIDMMHHVKKNKQGAFLKSVGAKLKPHGLIIFFEYSFSESESPAPFSTLSTNQKFACLKLIDWIGNILILKRKIPMPYSYRSLENWQKFFIKHNYRIISAKYLGFPKKFIHQGPYCLIIAQK